MHVSLYVCRCTCVNLCECVCVSLSVCAGVFAHLCACVCVSVHVYVCGVLNIKFVSLACMTQKVQNVKMVCICVCVCPFACVYLYCICGKPNIKHSIFGMYVSQKCKCKVFKKFFNNIIYRCTISFLWIAPV